MRAHQQIHKKHFQTPKRSILEGSVKYTVERKVVTRQGICLCLKFKLTQHKLKRMMRPANQGLSRFWKVLADSPWTHSRR